MLQPKDLQSNLRVTLSALIEEGFSEEEISSLVWEILKSDLAVDPRQTAPGIPVTGFESIAIKDGITFNPQDKTIHHKQKTISLSKNESRLLFTFLKFRGMILTHAELVQEMNQTYKGEDLKVIVRVWLHRLRKKLAAIPQAEHWIKSVQGKGYYFSID